jgi:RNA polymerase sigma-70 factor (ECF subfamily)
MEVMTGAFDRDLSGVIASAGAGDEIAFGRIVMAHHAEMHRVCVFAYGDQSIAEEAVQAAWSIAWKKIASVRDAQRLRPWLTSIAVDQARDLLRKRRRRFEIEVISYAANDSGGIDPATRIDAIDLRAALMALEPENRALLGIRYVAGFNATELSSALGISPSGVSNRLERLTTRAG